MQRCCGEDIRQSAEYPTDKDGGFRAFNADKDEEGSDEQERTGSRAAASAATVGAD